MFSKPVLSALTGVALLGSVAGYLGADLRFFAWKSAENDIEDLKEETATSVELQKVAYNLRLVAGTSYNNALARKEDQLANAQDKLYLCLKRGETCVSTRERIKSLERQIRDIKRDKKRLGG